VVEVEPTRRRRPSARAHASIGRLTWPVALVSLTVVLVACTAARATVTAVSLATTVAPTVAPTTVPTTTVPPTTTTTVPPTTTTTVAPTTTTTVPPTTTTTVAPGPDKAPPLIAPLPPLRSGAKGDDVVVLQRRLLDLGFWLDDVDGEYGFVTTQAVMAFQKFFGATFGLEVSGVADEATVSAMAVVPNKASGSVFDGDLFEVDKTRQLLFIIQAGKTIWTLNTSTGSNHPYVEVDQKTGGTTSGDAVTPEGKFKVYREYSDGWEKGQLGELYRPKYFSGGVAVHGAPNIPNYPASHGCVRVSTSAMDFIWAGNLLPQGMQVWVHA
jgi:peptidoglycan hydrolase-like protein with peptidoglycan-binding domain